MFEDSDEPNAENEPDSLEIQFIGSNNLIEDKYKFDDIIQLLVEHEDKEEGKEVNITIAYEEDSITLELPVLVKISQELNAKLNALIGSDKIIIT